ncbi:hypothetical protein A9Q81_17585 [Gammaproteobacteria bacterium 42_54_T18]|nr:hypothetical protein A9Q81_17585 [Gammaproteobacteria bacterium 42_54_T18]
MSSKNILIPLITPLNQNRSVCEDSIRALIDRSKNHTTGYIPCLTSGEGWKLTEDQWSDMLEYTRLHAPSHDVIVGIEKATTSEVLHYAKFAANFLANGLIITSPFGESITQHEIYQHYKEIHDKSGLKIYIYNESELSKNDINAKTLLKISKLKNVVGIKESSNSAEFYSIRNQLKHQGVRIYQGWEDNIVDDNLADGNICSLSNLYPELCLEAAIQPSDDLKVEIANLCNDHKIFSENWYAHIKDYLSETGVIASDHCINVAQ